MMTGEVEAELKGEDNIMYIVDSAEFSQNGSQVVFVLYNSSVHIWNTVTGELQIMTTMTTTLPDGSIVCRVGERNFHMFYPEQSTLSTHGPLSISDDCQWIVGALYDCWIPSHNQNFLSSSISGDKACLGYESGNVIIFDMKVAS